MIKKIPETQYRKEIEGISQSQLKRLLEVSPKEWQREQHLEKTETRSMITGTLAHAMALEGRSALDSIYAIDDWPQRTGKKRSASKEYQAFKKELEDTHKIYIKQEDIIACECMANVIHSEWNKIFSLEGDPEIAVYDLELVEGIKSKGLIDFLPKSKPYIFDLKTSATGLDDRSIRKKLLYEGWDIQSAYYHDLIEKETGESRYFIFLVIDPKTFQTRTVKVPPNSELMDYGSLRYKEAINIYKECIEANSWPGYETFDASELSTPLSK